MICVIAATCLFSACEKEESKPAPKPDATMANSRTVLVYMVAENNLSGFATHDNYLGVDTCDVNEMIEGMRISHLKKGDKLVLYIDDVALPRIYTLTNSVKENKIEKIAPEYEYEHDVNSASGEQLANVFDYVKTHHPAESYGIVFWSHGSGWIPPTYSGDVKARQRRAFGVDNGWNSGGGAVGNQMSIGEIADVLESNGGVDFIFFDACFMQTIELDYELRKAAKYIIASPAEIPGPGANYRLMVPAMFKEEGYAECMIDAYYNAYKNDKSYGVIISAVDEQRVDDFAAYMKTLVHDKHDRILNSNYTYALNYFDWYRYRSDSNMPDYYDIQGLMLCALDADEFQNWKTEFDKIIVGNKFTPTWYSSYPSSYGSVHTVMPAYCGGVSMFLPLVKKYARDKYVQWLKDSPWGIDVWNGIDSETINADE